MDNQQDNGFVSVDINGSGVAIKKSKSKGSGWKIFFGILFVFSIMINVLLLMALVISSLFFAGSGGSNYSESVIEKGCGSNKIAVIKIEGIINNELAEDITDQIDRAKEDNSVKAVIFKTCSPGGGVGASDRIYNEIRKFRNQTGKPAIAFMQTVAASGGVYTSSGCDKIIAEPTTITGSIGVIMGHFTLQGLFEEKLGIKSVVIKSGEKKDWPTTFEPVTEPQKQYLKDKLIGPAYERFVAIVAQSRPELSIEQVKALADGSIYNATEALENKLIDEIGYIDEAVELAKQLANIDKARVVEYEKPFSFGDVFGAESIFRLDTDGLCNMASPRLMYLWDAGPSF